MIRKTILGFAAAAGILLAQAPPPVPPPPGTFVQHDETIVGDHAKSTLTFVRAEGSFETMNVKGAPFTGDFVTESLQVLPDGNKIRNNNTTAYARDGEGRTRREMTINAIGPWAANGQLKTVFIHDPVAMVDYVLDPQAKTARKITAPGVIAEKAGMPPGAAAERVIIRRKVGAAADAPEGGTVAFGRVASGADVVMATPAIGAAPLPEGIVMKHIDGAGFGGVMIADSGQRGAAGGLDVKTDSLGKRIIEGVEAEGVRTTVTIPAGRIGNEHPLETVSERWFSNELKTVVLTTRKDPRMGETTYKLTNLRRGEPSATLFQVPPDYSVVEEQAFPPRMKLREKQE